MKISVFGMGKVGSATAFALVTRAIPHELVLVGRTREKVEGDAQDLLHASALVRPIAVVAGTVEETAASDIVLIAASADKGGGGDRMASADVNARLLAETVPGLVAASPGAVFVVLTNPVDVCTYVTLRVSGLAPGRVVGTGTLLDTARLRALLGGRLGVNAADIRAYILGEHGETQVAALSIASVGGERLDPADPVLTGLVGEAREGGHQVASVKGYTDYAVALAAAAICEAIADDSRVVLPVTSLVDGFLGISDVCLSLPRVIGRSGVERTLAIALDPDEADRLRRSAASIRSVLDRVMPGPIRTD